MSKRLKLSKLKSNLTANTRQKKPSTTIENDTEVVASKYFVAEILEPKAPNLSKKQIKIQYDDDDELKMNKKYNIVDEKSEKWEPENWKETYELIKEMRKNKTAPVDDMGCDKCSEENAPPNIHRYQCLLALMLSSQTKDQTTHAAMDKLKEHGCKPDTILATSDDLLGQLIYPVSFWKRKVQYIKKTTDILINNYKSDIPDTIDGLCSLPGVGPKMAHICMQVAWNVTSGIGVDTHVHRICNRLGWVEKKTKTPEDTRKQLESWLPKELWKELNHLLVGFGQEICSSPRPKCKDCLARKNCPFTI